MKILQEKTEDHGLANLQGAGPLLKADSKIAISRINYRSDTCQIRPNRDATCALRGPTLCYRRERCASARVGKSR